MKYRNRKKEDVQREAVLVSLPAYINQLILLLNGGMVLSEAMITIAKCYEKEEYKNLNAFETIYYDIYREAINSGRSFITAFNDRCKHSQIKELSRLSGILNDSDKRGVILLDKLLEESKVLWQQRKQIVLEQIRLSESKMSFPLGLLLIALIIIVAAPAMMQMYI